MIKFKDFYVSDSDYEEQMELFQNEHPNAEFIQITGGHMSPERIWFKYDDKLKEQPKLSIPKKIADKLDNEDANSKAVLDWVFATEMIVVNNEKALERREDAILKRRAIVSIYGASKALGVELVEVK